MREDHVEAKVETTEDVDHGALPVGARIGRFQVSAILGQGGFGITYRAHDEQLGRDVAIKEYLPSSLAIRKDGVTVLPRSTKMAEDFTWGRERFVAEGRTLASLHDAPAIVRVHDFLELNGTAYIVMELVRGDTLEDRIRRNGKLSAEEIDAMLWPLLDGLEQVHKAGFLHRDIKPANILLREDGRPTLIDFGASRAAMAGRTTAMTAIFTPGYAAAEQMTAAKQGAWTDIYGLAATLYHAITGVPPPPAFERMLDDEYEPLSRLAPQGFSPSLLVGLDAGLAVRATERPQTIAGWRGLLTMTGAPGGDLTQRVAVNPATTVRVPRPQAEVSPPAVAASEAAPPAKASSRTTLYAAAAAVALLLAGGGGYLATRPPPEMKVEDLERALAERRAAEAAAADKRRVEEEAKRKAEAEAAAKVAADSDVAKAEAARQKAEAELARLKAELEARRLDQETQARKAEAEAAQRKAEAEMAALKAAEDEARRKAALEAEAKRLADEALAKAQAERQKADEEAQRKAAAEAKEKSEASARQVEEAEKKAKADAEAKAKAAGAEADKKAAEAAETALRLAMPDRQKVQVALTSLGFDTRGSDGAFGPRSREMIGAWQKARNQPTTGFLTGTQHQALLREAAPALQKYDDDQKKKEEDEKKKADEAKKKAEDEAKAREATAAMPAPAAAPPAPPGGGPIPDGPYSGAFSSQHSFAIGSVINLKVTGTSATGTFSQPRCGTAPVNLKLSPSGDVSGDMTWFDSGCGRSPLTVRGRASGRQLQLNISGAGVSGASTLSPGSAAPAATAPAASPSPAPQVAASTPAVGGLRDGLYTGTMSVTGGIMNVLLQISIRMSGGSGTGTIANSRCGALPISLRADPSGRVTGDLKFSGLGCDAGNPGTVTGRVEGGAMSLEMTGSTMSARGRATLSRTGD